MNVWPTRRLGDIADESGGEIRTGPFGSQLHRHDYTDSADGVPVIMPVNMVAGRFNGDGVAKVAASKALEMSAHVTRQGDVLLSRRGDIGRYCLIDAASTGALCGTGSLRVSIQGSELMPEYLCLFLETSAGLHELQGKAVGSTMPNINSSIVRSLELPVPPLGTQRKIAAIVYDYDNLIEDNRRRITLLEEMAQRIYGEWFVDFRYPGHKESRLVSTALGPIPEGWEWHAASAALNINPRMPVDPISARPFVPMTSVSETVMHIAPLEERAGASGSRFENGDTLFARITPCLENGKTAYVQGLPDGVVGSGSTEFIVLRSRRLCPEYVYLLARSEGFRSHAIQSMSGATGRQRVREDCFDDVFVPVPTERLLKAFAGSVGPYFRLSHELFSANAILRMTRDLLLPRLVSGEIDVTDLDIAIPEAAA